MSVVITRAHDSAVLRFPTMCVEICAGHPRGRATGGDPPLLVVDYALARRLAPTSSADEAVKAVAFAAMSLAVEHLTFDQSTEALADALGRSRVEDLAAVADAPRGARFRRVALGANVSIEGSPVVMWITPPVAPR